MHSTSRYRLAWPTGLLAVLLGALALAATVGGSGAIAPPSASAQADGDFPIRGQDVVGV
jgi:hypothetical protein